MLIDELKQRGLFAQASDEDGLVQHLGSGSRTLYCGFDPTAESLQIGNLVPLLTLRRFQAVGHRPILLLGGATGLIGDPSGRGDERNLNDSGLVEVWVERIRAQVEPFLDFSGKAAAVIVNNLDWTKGLDVIRFLRDVGKHFSVNAMIQRESVKSRLDRKGEGISYTEFSYMLLQANDFLELAKRHGCSVQIGGSDQWGNIVSGMDLVRRQLGSEAFALTVPLIAKADGTKFGKTAAGAIWLDPAKTSPYAFYQFWLNSSDDDVIKFLKVFTFIGLDEIAELEATVASEPQSRAGQLRLAEHVTNLVHGAEALGSAKRISECLFGGGLDTLTQGDLEQLRLDGMDCTQLAEVSVGLLYAAAESGLVPSRGAARKLVQSKGLSVNGVVQEDSERNLDWSDALFGRFYLLRRGKKNWHLLVRA